MPSIHPARLAVPVAPAAKPGLQAISTSPAGLTGNLKENGWTDRRADRLTDGRTGPLAWSQVSKQSSLAAKDLLRT